MKENKIPYNKLEKIKLAFKQVEDDNREWIKNEKARLNDLIAEVTGSSVVFEHDRMIIHFFLDHLRHIYNIIETQNQEIDKLTIDINKLNKEVKNGRKVDRNN
jgi:hypothetical protein